MLEYAIITEWIVRHGDVYAMRILNRASTIVIVLGWTEGIGVRLCFLTANLFWWINLFSLLC